MYHGKEWDMFFYFVLAHPSLDFLLVFACRSGTNIYYSQRKEVTEHETKHGSHDTE